MRYCVLGAVAVVGDREADAAAGVDGAHDGPATGRQVPVPGRRERHVLAMLLAPAGAVVTADEFVEELWQGRPPLNARRTLASNISRLRSVLDATRPPAAGSAVVSVGGGWRLDAGPDDVDARRFESRATQALIAVREGRYLEARMHGDAASATWTGEPYRGHERLGRCAAEAERLSRLREELTEGMVDARLALGAGAELVAELEAAVQRDVLSERRWAQLMLAHYRAGSQSAALQTYRRARQALLADLGVEPGPVLRALHRDVLAQSPALHVSSYSLADPGTDEPTNAALSCPFKGLAPYGEADAGGLLGRERPLAKALAVLRETQAVCLTGPSGSGKTSMLRAAVVPAVRGGALPGSERWSVTVLTPGPTPLDRLRRLEAAEPADAGRTTGSLLVVDQLEELFTMCTDPAERRRFVAALIEHAERGTLIAFGVRADYWGELAQHAPLAELLAGSAVFLEPLTEDDVRLVVREGARRSGLQSDDDLVEAVVRDAANQPGILPHLSVALARTWERSHDGRLRLAGYEQAGGIVGALADSAEELWTGLDARARDAARRILLRLTTEDARGRVARNAVPAAELVRGEENSRLALDALVAARLLTTGDDPEDSGVRVAHESLFTGWPRLSKWLAEDAEARRTRKVVEGAAEQWADDGMLASDLLRGPRLVGALALLDAQPELLTHRALGFLAASREAAQDEARIAAQMAARERRTSRRLRALLVAVTTLLVVGVAAAGLAVRSRTQAEASRMESTAARLGAEALLERRPDLALLRAVQGVQLAPGSRTQLNLLATLQRAPRALAVTNLGARTVTSALSPDGRTLAVSSNVGDLWLLDSATLTVRRRVLTADGGGIPRVLFLSADEILYAKNGPGMSRLVVHDLSSGTERAVGQVEDVWRLEPVRDGRLLTATSALTVATLRRGADGRYTARPLPLSVTLSNGAADGSYAQLDRSSGRLALVGPDGVPTPLGTVPPGISVELSPDGRTFVVVDDVTGTIHLVDARSGRATGDLAGEPGFAEDVAFSPDSQLLAAGGDTGTITLWDVGTRTRLQTLTAGEEVVSLLFSPDGSVLYSTSMDGTNTRWDTTGRQGFGTTAQLPVATAYEGWDLSRLAGPLVAALPGDGTLVVVGGDGVLLLDPDTLAVRERRLQGVLPSSLSPSPDGTRLAVTTPSGEVLVVDPGSWQVTARIQGLATTSYASWDDRSTQLAVVEPERRSVGLYDAAGNHVRTLPLPGEPYRAAWRADRLVLSLFDGRMVVVDSRRGTIERTIQVPGAVDYFPTTAFLADGTLVTGSRDGTLQHWDLDTGTLVAPPSRVQPASMVTQLAALPDGRVVVGGGVAALVADPARPDVAPARLYGTSASWIAVDPRRHRVVTWDSLGTISSWDYEPASWVRRACAVIGDPPREQQWEDLLGSDVPYEPACGTASSP